MKNKYKNIALMGAMDLEVANLKSSMKKITKTTIAGFEFYRGRIENKNVVVFKSGIGKVNGALAIAIAIEHFNVDSIIFTGVAGGVGEKVDIGDVVISSALVEHDFDLGKLGTGAKKEAQNGIFKADKELISITKKAAIEVIEKNTLYTGIIATGDQFINDKKRIDEISRKYNALAVEMEGAAIAHVAHRYKIPFVVIRSISDTANHKANVDFKKFVKFASDISHSIVMKILESI